MKKIKRFLFISIFVWTSRNELKAAGEYAKEQAYLKLEDLLARLVTKALPDGFGFVRIHNDKVTIYGLDNNEIDYLGECTVPVEFLDSVEETQ